MAMKRRLQRRFYREANDTSPTELIAGIRQRVESGPFSEFWHDAPRAQPSQAKPSRDHVAFS